jgi:hypothetical protein
MTLRSAIATAIAALAMTVAIPGDSRADAACTPCLIFYDVSAGFHRFVGAQEVRRCGSRTAAGRQHVFGYVDNSDRAIFARIMSGDPGFDVAAPIGEACGKRNVAKAKRELEALTRAASAKYADLGYTVARQAATPLLNTACAEEAERARLALARMGFAGSPPVLESPFNLGEGAVPPPPPPP